MNIATKLAEWQQALLIDAQQAAAIRAYEDAQPSATKFLWRYGLLGLGLLAIGIGLLAIVASNWNAIPAAVKIGLHVLINLGVAGYMFQLWHTGPSRQWRFEGLLIVQAVLVLTLMALLGQILHTQSHLDDTMLLWWSLAAPMLLLLGQYRPSFVLWTSLSLFVLFTTIDPDTQPLLFFGLLIALIQLSALLPLFAAWRNHKPGWTAIGQKAGLRLTMIATNVMLIAPLGYWHAADSALSSFYHPGTEGHSDLQLFGWEIALGLNILLCAVLAYGRYRYTHLRDYIRSTDMTWRLIVLHLIIALFLSFAPAWFGWFLIYWFGVGYAGLRADDRRIVGLAITVLAIRIIVLYFDLTHSLMTTGLLMMASGLGVLYLVKTYPRWRAAILSATGGTP